MAAWLNNHKAIAAVAALAVAAGGVLVASNMGFKLVFTLEPQGPAALTGSNVVSLPYFSPTTTAAELLSDIPNGTQVSRWIASNDTLETYTGFKPNNVDFNLDPAEALLVKVGAQTDYVIVGSHDPDMNVSLLAQGAESLTGSNRIALPYHSTAATAADLLTDLCNGTQVSRFIRETDTLETYTGFKPNNVDFDLVIGEGLLVKVDTGCDWVPSHF